MTCVCIVKATGTPESWGAIMATRLKFTCICTVIVMATTAAQADTGVTGAWAADPVDCAWVNATEGVVQNVTAGIITPENVFFYGGECSFTGVYPRLGGMTFDGICDEGDGPYTERLQTEQTGPDTMRAMWPDIGWTTFHRCWDLPKDWKERSQ